MALHPRTFKPTEADVRLKVAQQKAAVERMWIIIASILAILLVVRFLRLTFSLLFQRLQPFPSEQPNLSIEKLEKGTPPSLTLPSQSSKPSWRRIPAAMGSAFRIISFRVHVPLGIGRASLAELFFILGYIATMLAISFTNTKDLSSWFFEDRSAHLASCQLPFIVALAGKNNLISLITGIGHEKLNILHRAAARTCLILLWVHALSRAISGLSPTHDFSHGWMRWGAVGLTAFTLLTMFSVRFIRNALFEFFLLSHIALVGIFIVGGYLHAREVNYGDYFWPALVVWAFDRVLRTARLIWNNRGWGSTQHEYGSATVELLSSDTIRMTLRRKMNWRPGQHAYVMLPTVSGMPSEAHPFTIASIPRSLHGDDESGEKDVVFLIRGRSGFTGRLREFASRNGMCRVPAFIDGPYGCPPDLTNFSTCILIAGGSGVSYTLPLLLNLVRHARSGSTQVRRVIFVWAVRESDHLGWISNSLSEASAVARSTSLAVDTTMYITGSTCTIPQMHGIPYDGSSANSETGDTELPVYSSLKVIHGKPSIRRIIHEGVNGSSGSVSVDVSGPTSLTQSVSRVLCSKLTSPKSVLKGAPSVTLHVETFGMSR